MAGLGGALGELPVVQVVGLEDLVVRPGLVQSKRKKETKLVELVVLVNSSYNKLVVFVRLFNLWSSYFSYTRWGSESRSSCYFFDCTTEALGIRFYSLKSEFF